MNNRPSDRLGDLFVFVTILPTMASFGIGALVLAYQVMHWLEYAVWPIVTLRDGLALSVRWLGGTFDEGSTGALGVDQIIGWCLDGPLSLWMMLILPLTWLLSGIFLFQMLFGNPKQ
jgi:hypothetical protein